MNKMRVLPPSKVKHRKSLEEQMTDPPPGYDLSPVTNPGITGYEPPAEPKEPDMNPTNMKAETEEELEEGDTGGDDEAEDGDNEGASEDQPKSKSGGNRGNGHNPTDDDSSSDKGKGGKGKGKGGKGDKGKTQSVATKTVSTIGEANIVTIIPRSFTTSSHLIWQAKTVTEREWGWPQMEPGDWLDTYLFMTMKQRGITLGGYTIEERKKKEE